MDYTGFSHNFELKICVNIKNPILEEQFIPKKERH